MKQATKMKTVLIVTERPQDAVSLLETVEAYGARAVSCCGVDEARSYMDAGNRVDVVLAEAFLNDGYVFEFLKLIRQNADHQNLPIIIVAIEPGEIGRRSLSAVQIACNVLGASCFVTMDKFDPSHINRELENFLPKS